MNQISEWFDEYFKNCNRNIHELIQIIKNQPESIEYLKKYIDLNSLAVGSDLGNYYYARLKWSF